MADKPVTIKTISRPFGTPVAGLFPAALVELHTLGYGNAIDTPSWDCDVVYAEAHGEPVGFIAFKYATWNRSMEIIMSYVRPAFRRQGIYRRMYECVLMSAKGAGATTIRSFVQADNLPMGRAAESVGRRPEIVGYVQHLPLGDGE